MRAAWHGQAAIIPFLISRGACVDEKDKHGETALQIAVSFNEACIAALLRSYEHQTKSPVALWSHRSS